MGEFLQNNWFWLLLIVFFFWMHGSGMGCGGHGGHSGHGRHGRQQPKDGEADSTRSEPSGHRH